MPHTIPTRTNSTAAWKHNEDAFMTLPRERCCALLHMTDKYVKHSVARDTYEITAQLPVESADRVSKSAAEAF
jgi:hypothetical protein